MNDVTFQKRLQSVLSDNKFDRNVTGKRAGKLDTRRLHKIEISQKLFKKKEERKNKEYSVMLLVDTSSSMSGSKAKMAGAAAALLAKQLDKAGVALEVYAFNQVLFPLKQAFAKHVDYAALAKSIELITWGLNDLLEDTINQTLHHTSDPDFEEQCKRIASTHSYRLAEVLNHEYCSNSCGSNSDGEMVHVVVRKLLKTKGKKILIVLSDGQPTSEHQWSRYVKNRRIDSFNLKHEVQDAINKGVTFIGIGIQSTAVKSYYPANNVAVVTDLNQLYPAVIDKLKRLIKRG